MLAERLRELEAGGIVVRHVDAGPLISVSYALAEQADALEAALRAFKAWAATTAS
ncbi:MAG: winged helix-turn-helix transcriptional regulator [Actinobacteria bacterium]|nr:winged helix-turn-helix transcriptional regulator [Actinomycetota bacterium]